MQRRFSTLLLLLFMATLCRAQVSEHDSIPIRPVTSAVTLLWGNSKVRDSYLTPLSYEGASFSLQYDRWRRSRSNVLVNQQIFTLRFATGEDQGHYTSTWSGRLSYRYATHYPLLHSDSQWQPMIGLYANLEVGFTYNLKLTSSNNPATARLVNNYGLSAATVYRFSWRGQPCNVLFQAQTPLLGWALAPEYGESYYEYFYLKQLNGYAFSPEFTSLHRQQDLDLKLTTDLPVSLIPWLKKKSTVMRLGVEYHIETAKINDIVTRYSSFQFVIGWSYRHIPLHHNRRHIVKNEMIEAF